MIDEITLQRLHLKRTRGYLSYGHGPSDWQVRRLFDHQRWLNSEGRAGERLKLDWKSRGKGGRQMDFIEADISGVDLSRAVLADIGFAFSNLKHVRFTGAELRGVRFIGCDIEGADFSGATLEDVTFEEETNCEKARFDEANAQRVQLNKWCTPTPQVSPKL